MLVYRMFPDFERLWRFFLCRKEEMLTYVINTAYFGLLSMSGAIRRPILNVLPTALRFPYLSKELDGDWRLANTVLQIVLVTGVKQVRRNVFQFNFNKSSRHVEK